MSAVIHAFCPLCEANVEIPYILLGSLLRCPVCDEVIVPEIREGTIYPNTGYDIRFSDFQQLLSSQLCRSVTADLLRKWYNYKIIVKRNSLQVCSSDDCSVDLLELHKLIQADSEKQVDLYKIAMAMWR